jgi:hypothetical protein
VKNCKTPHNLPKIGHVLSALPEDECLKQLELVIARYVMRVEQICQQQPTQQNRAALIEGQN